MTTLSAVPDFVQGMVDRCTSTPGHTISGDSTCVRQFLFTRSRAPSRFFLDARKLLRLTSLLLFFSFSQVYTGGAAITDTTYAQSCANGAPVTAPAPSQAPYKRKRKVLEPSPFVGGRICPIGEQACPLSTSNAFECINIKENLG